MKKEIILLILGFFFAWSHSARPQAPMGSSGLAVPVVDLSKYQENIRITATFLSTYVKGSILFGSDLAAGDGDDSRDYTGWSVTSADINGDGFDDAILGTLRNVHVVGKGMVYIIYGQKNWEQSVDLDSDGAPIPGITRILGKNKSFAGSAVASGDINSDGYSDLVIGAFGAGPQNQSGREGEVYVLYGSNSLDRIVELTTSTHITTIKGNNDDRIGEFAGCYDVNSDSYWDVLVSQPFYSRHGAGQAGKVFVVYGGPESPGSY